MARKPTTKKGPVFDLEKLASLFDGEHFQILVYEDETKTKLLEERTYGPFFFEEDAIKALDEAERQLKIDYGLDGTAKPKVGLFDIINSLKKKTQKLLDLKNDPVGYEEAEKAYVPWTINNALSMNEGSIFAANEMNRFPSLPKQMQHDFLYHGTPKISTFDKWIKYSEEEKQKDEQIAELRKWFPHCSPREIRYYLDLLNGSGNK